MKLKNYLITILMILLNIFWAVFLFLLIYPFKVIEIKSVEILTPVVMAGEQVKIRIEGCKYFSVPAVAQRKIINHYEYFLTAETTNDLTTGCFVKEMSVPIPGYVDSDIYHIHNDLEHTLFGFRKINTHWESPTFQVIARQ